MAEMTETNMEYQMFKGLQRPLEFMGLQGRYITWAAVTARCRHIGLHVGLRSGWFPCRIGICCSFHK